MPMLTCFQSPSQTVKSVTDHKSGSPRENPGLSELSQATVVSVFIRAALRSSTFMYWEKTKQHQKHEPVISAQAMQEIRSVRSV